MVSLSGLWICLCYKREDLGSVKSCRRIIAVTIPLCTLDIRTGRVFWGDAEEIFRWRCTTSNRISLEYPEYLVPSEDEAPIEDQPLPADASPVALSPGYVPDSDPEEDLEEDSEEEHVISLLRRGMEDDEPSGDDTDDDDADDDEEEPFEDEEDDEEEHLAPADSPVIPVVDPVPSAGDIEAFETDESAPTPRDTSDQGSPLPQYTSS
ncbi:hypothetical protein Tco_1052825 [Tanacetum coccineum]